MVEDTVGRTYFSVGVSKVLVQSLTVLFWSQLQEKEQETC